MDNRLAEGHKGVTPRKFFLKFETQFGAIWYIWARIDGSLVSTFVNENIVIMIDRRIDIVAYYFNCFISMNAFISCCSRRLACSGRVSRSSYSPEVGVDVLLQGE